MNFSIISQPLQSLRLNQLNTRRLSCLGLILFVSLSLAACQKRPTDITPPIDSIASPTKSQVQQTAEIWFDPNTLELVVNPTKIADNLSGITVRVQLQPGSYINQIDTSKKPFIVSESLLEQGWTTVINLFSETPEGEIWADLAVINTQPEGIALTDLTTIATLSAITNTNIDDGSLSPVIDLNVTKIMTKSAQEVGILVPNEIP